ncbi:tumor protein p53-inducible protein 13 isoform X2 [Anolis carolinensis]|uniref:tumor protein p53-inducible protein 13 isoform X2 n=1 Tax=Anolis carolinensis TaxID=28377 RepID=UPI000462AEF7|nr:PREDICTED: tumor protein p53-inducible protein 13 isoform X2 [Anolis carolinensis]|eukprot:XP_008118538.1 PREDICTED: tumor protein p53-inducible protein 13 isoform X2 [Anolis carolinensis]
MEGLHPPPSPPCSALLPSLLFLFILLCSLVSGEAGKESKGIFPGPEKVKSWNVSPKSGAAYENFSFHRLKVSRNLVWTKRHRQRASNWPKWLSGGFRHLAGQPETTTPPPSVSKPETPVSTPVSTPEVRAGCRCPEEAEVAKAQQGKAEEARRRGVRLPTPRTEEAAWAASALTFLLVVLTVAILYTRLHRKCRRGRSLYWMVSGEEDRETVAAVIKRRLLSSQIRRKKRPRKKQQELLVSTSSDSSD